MKNLIYLICFAIITSCDTNVATVQYSYKIENNSGKDIVITSYNSLNPTEIKRTIAIANNNFFLEVFNSKEGDNGVNTFIEVFQGDSITVSYNNNERIEIFTCVDRLGAATGCDEERNLLSFNITGIDETIGTYTIYKFTTTDYDNAND